MYRLIVSAALLSALAVPGALANEPAPAKQLSFKECGAQYQAAKAADELNGRKWMDYRRDVCGIAPPAQRPPMSEAQTAQAVARLTFPASVDSAFASETPSRQRMRTCLKSYHEAKKADALYGVRWVQKGGGYYSLCNARLKQAGA